MSEIHIEPGFLDGPVSRLFYVRYCPQDFQPRRRLLLCPPFAEEMNKSRHMYSALARAAASRGVEVLSVDVSGTGDSAGDTAGSCWNVWCQDMVACIDCFESHGGLSLLGLRLGANLALDVAAMLPQTADRIIVWHPVANGRTFVSQFLRLRVAAEMTMPGKTPTTTELRELATRDGAVEVAGYMLSDKLLSSIESLDLLQRPPPAASLRWLELSSAEVPALSGGSKRVLESWRSHSNDLESSCVAGTPFWNTAEIQFEPEFVEQSIQNLIDAPA